MEFRFFQVKSVLVLVGFRPSNKGSVSIHLVIGPVINIWSSGLSSQANNRIENSNIAQEECGREMPLKIWIVNTNAIPPSLGGLCRHHYIKRYLERMGHSVRLFTSSQIHNSEVNMIEGKELYVDRTVDGIEYTFIRSSRYKSNSFARIWNFISFPVNILRTLGRFSRPDVIYSSTTNLFTATVSLFFAKRKKIPCVVEIRDLFPEALFSYGFLKEKGIPGRILTAIEHWTYKNTDALIFTKEGDVDYLKEQGWYHDGDVSPGKCHYVNNGVDLDEFQDNLNRYTLSDPDLESGKFTVTYCGSIRAVTNVRNIVEAALLLRGDPDVQFLIFGKGTMLPGLKVFIEENKLDYVKLKGFVEKKYIPFILSKSSLNILNYSSEKYNWSRGNSSNKLFEYMASGKPILSTVKMGYCPLEKYNCGISIPMNTPEEFAAAVLEMKEMNPEEYTTIGNNARMAAQDFDYKVIAGKLDAILRGVVEEKC